jgi:tripartite-type tricarboxylate transporter receptor subunit TctC
MPAVAQDYPTKNITLIVPFAAGGPTDVISRIVGEHMSRTLGHQNVIEMLSARAQRPLRRARSAPHRMAIR